MNEKQFNDKFYRFLTKTCMTPLTGNAYFCRESNCCSKRRMVGPVESGTGLLLLPSADAATCASCSTKSRNATWATPRGHPRAAPARQPPEAYNARIRIVAPGKAAPNKKVVTALAPAVASGCERSVGGWTRPNCSPLKTAARAPARSAPPVPLRQTRNTRKACSTFDALRKGG